METALLTRHAKLAALGAALSLLLTGCSAASGLFGDSASTLASNGGTIADAVSAIAGPSDSYCRKGPAESSGDEGTSQSSGTEMVRCDPGCAGFLHRQFGMSMNVFVDRF